MISGNIINRKNIKITEIAIKINFINKYKRKRRSKLGFFIYHAFSQNINYLKLPLNNLVPPLH